MEGEIKLKQGPISENDLMANLIMAKKIMKRSDVIKPVNQDIINSQIDEEYNIQDDVIDVREKTYQEKLEKSNLPTEIKLAMAKTQPKPVEESFFKKTKQLMESENLLKKPTKPQSVSTKEIVETLKPILRQIIDEALDKKLEGYFKNQKTNSLNENIMIKVGNSVFKGKITSISK